jgi:hypothetical protein
MKRADQAKKTYENLVSLTKQQEVREEDASSQILERFRKKVNDLNTFTTEGLLKFAISMSFPYLVDYIVIHRPKHNQHLFQQTFSKLYDKHERKTKRRPDNKEFPTWSYIKNEHLLEMLVQFPVTEQTRDLLKLLDFTRLENNVEFKGTETKASERSQASRFQSSWSKSWLQKIFQSLHHFVSIF